MAKTLIVGATGPLGREMVKACMKHGHEIHALVRPATRRDSARMALLEAAGATIHEGDLNEYNSLAKACKAVDSVISAFHVARGDERTLVRAVKDAGVKRFVPSAGFGLDFSVVAPGSCAPLDMKRAIYESIKAARIPYTIVHTNGFFTSWVFTLGDLTRLGGELPPAEVNVYGDGNVKGAFVSEPDVATVTVRALSDPTMRDKEVRITQNTVTQNEIIDLWQEMSGRSVKKVRVTANDIERLIASATAPDVWAQLGMAQLHRSFWICGESVKRSPNPEAAELYPDITFQTVKEGFATLF